MGKGKRFVWSLSLGNGPFSLCTSLNPADMCLGVCSVPLHFLLLIKDFVQHHWRLVVVCSPPPSVSYPLCKGEHAFCPELATSCKQSSLNLFQNSRNKEAGKRKTGKHQKNGARACNLVITAL